jgi:predicted NAD-dependent protein-ADP-ribosyltransferase YbiA (DUF1768 family)
MDADDLIDFNFGETKPTDKPQEESKIDFDVDFFESAPVPAKKEEISVKTSQPIKNEKDESNNDESDKNEEENDDESENESEEDKTVVQQEKTIATKEIKTKKQITQRKKPKIKRLKRTKKIPRPDTIKDTLSFFRARTLYPKEFDFNTDGNLQVPDVEEMKGRIIELPYYIEKTPSEKNEYLETVQSEIRSIETEMDEKMRMLREAMGEWRETGVASRVVELQRDLARLDAQRTIKRDGERWTVAYTSLENRQLIFQNRYDDKKVQHPVFALQIRDIPFTQLFKTSSERPEQQEEEEEELNLTERQETFLIFSAAGGDGGYFAPDNMKEFSFNGQVYNSLLQAFHAERAAFVKRADLRIKILQQQTAKDIRIWGNRFSGNFENPKGVMIDILKAYVSKYPGLKKFLIKSDSDILIYANPIDRLLGIGLNETDDDVLDREKWKSPNILGEAWMAIREPLLQNTTAQQGGGGADPFEGEEQIELDNNNEEQERIKEERSNYFKGVQFRKKVGFA